MPIGKPIGKQCLYVLMSFPQIKFIPYTVSHPRVFKLLHTPGVGDKNIVTCKVQECPLD